MNSLDEILNKIIKIEETLNINQFIVKGLNIWPLIRIEIIRKLRANDFTTNNKLSISIFLKHFISLFELSKLFKHRHGSLFLVYGVDKSGRTVIENEVFDKQFSPFLKKFGSKRIKIIEFGLIDSCSSKSQFTNVTSIYYIFKPFLNFYYWLSFLKISKKIKNFLYEITLDDKNIFNKTLIEFYSRKLFFKFLLKYLKPKNVFVKSFNNITAMAVVAGASELKINTIEYQHGQQGENSLTYSNWNNMPKNGFKMLPKYFWVYRKKIYKEI